MKQEIVDACTQLVALWPSELAALNERTETILAFVQQTYCDRQILLKLVFATLCATFHSITIAITAHDLAFTRTPFVLH